ncbi:MAG: UDP-3-O-(3-hydroxymyristoyl)glucosamine N-acyltransferase [Epsilonproteobacteria bacterium]|nr:UDP-3-O-(3-hydroxymyristoyl)glucosamine N-acyltransferase [Campylobacterota bacterium]NPA56220.1 UDP-3-O-(3-hydroxymyristoyl)glucosamine N-acyltransferase [Campylobacterota bacterium]
MRLGEIAERFGLRLVGEDRPICGLEALPRASECHLSFLESRKYLSALKETRAGGVIMREEFLPHLPKGSSALISEEPYLTLAYITELFATPPFTEEGDPPTIGRDVVIGPNVYIGHGAQIGDGVTLMPGTFVGDRVTIGEGTTIYPNVTIYHNCQIGKRCIIHAGTVIGSDGYGFAHTRDGRHVKIYQNGNVVVEDDVEIGANCTIDRAVFGTTLIKRGTKLDNLIQIGHNCEIGENVLMASLVGISGSTTLGRNVVMGGQSATAGHLKIGDFATIAARGGVTKSLEGGKTYAGFPIMEHRLWLKLQALLARMVKRGDRG